MTLKIPPSVEPIGHGRPDSGVSDAATVQASPTPTIARVAPASVAVRRRGGPSTSSTASSTSAGRTISASNNLMLNARPTVAPAATTTHGLRRCAPTTTSQAASRSSAIITESIVSLWAVRIAVGRSASAAAAPRPAVRPNSRRTRSYNNGIASVPARTSGSRTATPENPSSLTLSTCSHRSAGALSIETCPPGSNAPKKRLCQDRPMLRTAAS